MSLVQPGSIAPDFSAEASDGRTYQLRSQLQESRVLLVFYPGNNTPG
jgi:peroxiredoxin